jgi:hypothetical protein
MTRNPKIRQSKRACDFDDDEMEFIKAVQKFREENKRIPSNTQILQIVKDLGYRKTTPLEDFADKVLHNANKPLFTDREVYAIKQLHDEGKTMEAQLKILEIVGRHNDNRQEG